MSKIVLGIDPASFKNMGLCVAEIGNEKMKILMRTTKIFNVNKDNKDERFIDIKETIDNIIDKYKVEVIVFERTKFGLSFVMSQIYETIGVIKLESQIKGVRLIEVSPMTAKKIITGSGKAKKNEVMDCVKKEFQIEKKDLSSDHEADAIALAFYLQKAEEDVRK